MELQNQWRGMDTRTQQARTLKAKKLRECRLYLKRVLEMGLSEKSASVRFWRKELADWRAAPIYAIIERFID